MNSHKVNRDLAAPRLLRPANDSLVRDEPGQVSEALLRRLPDEMRGSAVMPTARLAMDPEWLLDELELRLTRCAFDTLPTGPTMRTGGVRHLGASLHHIAWQETRGWWNTHQLANADDQVHASILRTLLERSSKFLAWAAVPLIQGHLRRHVGIEQVTQIVSWVTSPEPAELVVRDAIALNLLVPWLQTQAESDVCAMFLELCHDGDAARTRLGVVSLAAYVRGSNPTSDETVDVALDVCWQLGAHVDPETAMSIGWLLKELIVRHHERVLPILMVHIQGLSRQAMRTAVEGLPRETRARLTNEWRGNIRHSASHAMPSGGARSGGRPRVLRRKFS